MKQKQTTSYLTFTAAVVLMCLHAVPDAALPQAPAHDAGWAAPARAAAIPNPLANRPDVAAGGRKVFAERCSTCHGADGRGTPKAPDLAGAGVQAQSDGALFWKISSGNTRRGMPSFSFLPPPQRWQLVLSLRALGKPPQAVAP
jgi:mono/diheme cytochrome c family protein